MECCSVVPSGNITEPLVIKGKKSDVADYYCLQCAASANKENVCPVDIPQEARSLVYK